MIVNKEDCLISNSSEEKAISMLINIFRNSDVVHLFTNNEKPNVSNDSSYEFAIRTFLNRRGEVFLVVKNMIELEKAFRIYKLLYIYAMERPTLVKVAIADQMFLDDIKDVFGSRLNNFCVGNKRFIRIEHDTDNFHAKASDSPALGEKLSRIIENCIERSNIIDKVGKEKIQSLVMG